MPPPPPSATAGALPGTARLRGRLMAQALGKLLDRVRGSRDVLPHLAALERGLLDQGLAVLNAVPARGLAKICSQLSSLPLAADDQALHELLDHLSATPESRRAERGNLPFDIERAVAIAEISHSAFMAAARGEEPTQPDELHARHGGGG